MATEFPRTGRWENIRTRFLEKNRPEELKRMREDSTLTEYMNSIEDEYNEKFDRMQSERLKSTQLEVRYGKGELELQEYLGEFNQIRNEIYELLTAELCK